MDKSEILKLVGKRIKNLRESKGISQVELVGKMEGVIDPTNISRIESEYPSLDVFEKNVEESSTFIEKCVSNSSQTITSAVQYCYSILPTISLLLTKEYMDKLGFILTHKIIGVTIRAYQWIEFKHKIHLSITRGIEIKQWLDTNLFSNNGKNFKRNL